MRWCSHCCLDAVRLPTEKGGESSLRAGRRTRKKARMRSGSRREGVSGQNPEALSLPKGRQKVYALDSGVTTNAIWVIGCVVCREESSSDDVRQDGALGSTVRRYCWVVGSSE